MAHVQTVLGPIEPADLGFTLPHEHTQIALWHIPDRWDYWQLTRDEPVILEELARYRAAGGGALVDLTLPGVGRDPAWLRRLAEASGLHLVMGCGWYRTAYYPPEARIDRRSVDDLADELVREAEDGSGGLRDPARDHRGDRHGQAVGLASRGARPSGGGPRVAPDRAGHHDPWRPVGRRARPAPDLRGGGRRSRARRHRPRRFVSGPRPPAIDHRAWRQRRVRLHRDALAQGTRGRDPHGRARLRAAVARPRRPDPAQPGRLQRRPAPSATAATATPT